MTFSILRLLLNLLFSCFLTFLFLDSASASDAKPGSIFDLGQISFETRGNHKQIPKSTIMALAQDSQGFVWVGTQRGLVRYDGYSYVLFKHQANDRTSLSGNYIKSLWPSENGKLWIGTLSDGVSVYDPLENSFIWFQSDDEHQSSMSNNQVNSLIGDNQNRVYIGTNEGLNIIDSKTHKIQQLGDVKGCPVSMSSHQIHSLLLENSKVLWIGTSKGLCRLALDQLQPDTPNEELVGIEVDSIKNKDVTTLYRTRDNRIWVGTRNDGLYFLPNDTSQISDFISRKPSTQKALIHPSVTGMTQVNQDELWVGTYGGGISVVNPNTLVVTKQFRHDQAISNSLNFDSIASLLLDKSGLLWIGTRGGGLNLYNPHNTAFRTIRSTPFNGNSLAQSNSLATLELENKHIWVGHDQQVVDIIDTDNGTITPIKVKSNPQDNFLIDSIRVIKKLNDGAIWLATANTQVFVIAPEDSEFQSVDLSGTNISGAIRSMVPSNQNQIWIGSDTGIGAISTKTKLAMPLDKYKGIEQLANKSIMSLAYQAPENLWVGTSNGLYIINLIDNAVSDISQTLSDNFIMDIVFDRNGRAIIGNAQGIDRLIRFDGIHAEFESLDDLVGRPRIGSGNLMEDAYGRIWDSQGWLDPQKSEYQLLDVADGFDKNTIWMSSNTQTHDSILIYGDTKGLLLVRPELWQPWEYQPPIVVTELSVDNQIVPMRDALELTSVSNSFSVEFAALDYTDPDSNQYAYMLNGFDKDWITTSASNRRATYTNLPPGQYQLKVKGTNRKGLWSDKELNLSIRKMPTWYQTPGFRFAMLLSISGLLLGFYKWRVRRLKNQKIELDDMVKSRTANISMLGTIGQEITATLNLDKVLETVYQHVNTLMRAEIFAIGIVDWEKQVIQLPFCIENGERLPPIRYTLSDTDRPAVWCIQNQKELRINERAGLAQILQNVQDPISGGKSESLIYLPLLVDQRVIGCISVQSFSQNAYDDNDVQMLRTIANYAAIALANADSVEKLEKTLQELKETQNQLVQQEKMAGLGTLTAGVMHEINNPTNFTYSSLYSLREKHDELFAFLRKLAGGDDADQEIIELFKEKRDELESITCTAEEGTRRIKKIVADLQNLSRIDKDQKKRANIKELLDSSINLTRTKFPNHTFDTQGVTGVNIACYPAKLSQVLLNLLVNACQAIEEAKTNNPDLTGLIKLKTEVTEGDLQLSIVDNGCGMDDITLKKAFEPFFTTKDVGSGTGLGMSISYGITKEHGGTMTVESKPGKGTTIRLHLPL